MAVARMGHARSCRLPMLEPDLLTVSLDCTTMEWRREAGRGGEMEGDRELDFYLAKMKMNQIMTERNVAASGQGRSEKCSAGYKE